MSRNWYLSIYKKEGEDLLAEIKLFQFGDIQAADLIRAPIDKLDSGCFLLSESELKILFEILGINLYSATATFYLEKLMDH